MRVSLSPLSYLILGVSFLASTGLLIRNSRASTGASMVIAHSHLFFFFPMFGTAGAFCLLPALGRLHRSLLAPSALRQAALFGWPHRVAAVVLRSSRNGSTETAARHLGGVAGALLADGRSRGLRRRRQHRLPPHAHPDRARDLRAEGQARVGLSKFARNCQVDDLLELPDEMDKKRYCFAAERKAQGRRLLRRRRALRRRGRAPAGRSVHALPFRQPSRCRASCRSRPSSSCIVIAIGILLRDWRSRVDLHLSRTRSRH